MTDQYKDQYKKETEQIHAPADLIARTKAAVREEEARIQAERTAQTAGLAKQAAEPVAQEVEFPAQEISVTAKKGRWGAAVRKWAYPLSAVAAIIVLVSVSMMMRGLGKSNLDSEAPYESAAADCGGEETAAAGAAEEAFDEAFPAESAMETEGAEADRKTGAAADMVTEMESASADAGAVLQENFASGKGADFADDTAGAAAETERTLGSTDAASEALPAEAGETENATAKESEIKEALADRAASDLMVEKVWKKPAFVNRENIESRTYKDMVFQMIEEEDGWAAYVESENGGGYVIRGEAENVEAFLEEGYRRLEEMSW